MSHFSRRPRHVARRPLALAAAVLAALASLCGAPAWSAAPSRLSDATILATLAAIAADTRELQLRTLEAALAEDATIDVQSSATGTPQSARYSKREYLAVATQVFAGIRRDRIRYTYVDDPPAIRVAADGRSAVVVGTSRETFAFPDGRSMTTTTRSTLRFAWRDGRAAIDGVEAIDLTPPPTMP
jgi:hypothetical protein